MGRFVSRTKRRWPRYAIPVSEVRTAERWSMVLPGIMAAALVASVALSPAHAVWDEQWYLANCRALLQAGFTTAYLRDFHVSTGPLFSLIHAVPYQLSGGSVYVARSVNLLFWAVSSALVYYFARQVRRDDA